MAPSVHSPHLFEKKNKKKSCIVETSNLPPAPRLPLPLPHETNCFPSPPGFIFSFSLPHSYIYSSRSQTGPENKAFSGQTRHHWLLRRLRLLMNNIDRWRTAVPAPAAMHGKGVCEHVSACGSKRDIAGAKKRRQTVASKLAIFCP